MLPSPRTPSMSTDEDYIRLGPFRTRLSRPESSPFLNDLVERIRTSTSQCSTPRSSSYSRDEMDEEFASHVEMNGWNINNDRIVMDRMESVEEKRPSISLSDNPNPEQSLRNQPMLYLLALQRLRNAQVQEDMLQESSRKEGGSSLHREEMETNGPVEIQILDSKSEHDDPTGRISNESTILTNENRLGKQDHMHQRGTVKFAKDVCQDERGSTFSPPASVPLLNLGLIRNANGDHAKNRLQDMNEDNFFSSSVPKKSSNMDGGALEDNQSEILDHISDFSSQLMSHHSSKRDIQDLNLDVDIVQSPGITEKIDTILQMMKATLHVVQNMDNRLASVEAVLRERRDFVLSSLVSGSKSDSSVQFDTPNTKG